MDYDDSWDRQFTSSKCYQYKPGIGLVVFDSETNNSGEEYDGEEENRPEFMCPFCVEDFDIVGLCCHIDEEHPVEAKNGMCPVCAKRVGTNLVGHITQHHGNILKVQGKRKLRRGGASALSISRKDSREGSSESILEGSSSLVCSSSDPDPLISSFIRSTSLTNELPDVQPLPSAERSSKQTSTSENSSERNVKSPSPLSDKEQGEQVRRSKFVQGLLLSTILEEI